MTKTFPKLYKKASTGKISEWEVFVEENNKGHGVINVVHGYIDGKHQHDKKTVDKGKNEGKANETTPLQQALSEAESKWKKQKDKGYVETVEETDEIVYLPMLAQTFDKRGKHITYPCAVQRKFDGVRCLAFVKKGEVFLLSRKGKRFPHMEHLFSQIKSIAGGRDMILDGELYSEELTFQRTVGLVKKETLKKTKKQDDEADQRKIMYRLYDCILPQNPNATFATRYGFMMKLMAQWKKTFRHIKLTQNVKAKNEEDIKRFHDQFVAEGYEGIIIRNIEGIYGVNKRSNDLQKYKHFIDEEFKIVGFEEGTGRAKGTVIWICQNKKKQKFKVRPRGTEKERRNWFENGKDYVGKKLTVRYQELTDDGIPRFPVGITIRDYE